ncbi:alpha/beta fold hydrolase [Amycolatopsis suaedae]|uniref:Alpha/beta fold hydrolase n=1 Tax=Amycolatopsis suaedae TaxID=2510978 RepID=A0A4Q7J780_9PSEU|nr:alpha/beta hydrolase [Amycolatopsis suaedae]RZQ62642.1 alpha/beta fold hydrolase [Amycolatopsis suaedae]
MGHSQLSPHSAVRTELAGLAALRAGERGPIALLLPGYTGSKEDFAPVLDELVTAGFQVVALDLPGQYESGGPVDEEAYLPGALGQVVADVVTELAAGGQPVLLLGHSYGGLVARSAVLAGAPVAGLTLMDTGPEHLPADGMRYQALGIGEELLREGGLEPAYALREEISARFEAWLRIPAEVKAFLRARFVASSAAGLLGMARALREEPDRVGELAAALRSREAPCLVVAGENDDAWSPETQRDMARRLDARFELVPGAAHSPNTENPAALLKVIVPVWRSWVL